MGAASIRYTKKIFTAMNIQQLADADYLDILFEGRNKSYGAFELRRHYARRTKCALSGVLALAALVAAYPLFAGKASHTTAIYESKIQPHLLNVTSLPKPAKPLHPVVPPRIPPPPPVASTIAIVPPVITSNIAAINPPKSIDSLEGKTIGAIDTKGDPGGLIAATDLPHGGHGDPKSSVEVPGPKPPETHIEVDQMPEFKGNIGDWLSDHLQYPEAAHEAGITGRVMVQFVVAENGAISEVTVLGGPGHGLDAEAARVVKLMPRWKPGRLNGQPVRTQFRLPVQFVLGD